MSASSAVVQTQTHSHSASVFTNSMRLSPITRLSSTIAILVINLQPKYSNKVLTEGQFETNDRAFSGLAADFKPATQLFQAGPHVDDAVHPGCLVAHRPAAAIVRHGQTDVIFLKLNAQQHLGRTGMPHDVRERFLER